MRCRWTLTLLVSFSTYVEKSRDRKQDKTYRGNDGMRCHTGSSAEGNDYGKIKEYDIIEQEVFPVHKMVPCQETQNTGKDDKKYIQMEFVALAPYIFREHAHPNHYIPYSDQDGNEYGKKTGVEEQIF